jgi:sulfur relay (sulfurtransferase) DsrC/TusE family protein
MTGSQSAPVFAGKTSQAYITTIKQPIPGYMVRIPAPGEEGKYLQKAFRKVDGDMAQLLAAAIGWRDAMCQQHWGITAPHRVFHKKQANSSTGFPGVRKVVKTVKKQCTDGTVAEYKIPCIIAEIWLEPGKNERRPKKSRSKVFSLNKFSVEDAYLLAVTWREEQETLLRQPPRPAPD